MKILFPTLVAVVAFAVIGCNGTKIDLSRLAKEIDAVKDNTMHRGVYYAGTDEDNHYIVAAWDKKKDELFLLSVEYLSVENQISPTKDNNSWREFFSGNSSVPPNGYTNSFTKATTYYYIKTEPNKSL